MKLVVLVTATLGSAIGGWLGRPFGIFSVFVLSIVGTGVGIWGGRRLAQHWGLR